MSLELNAEELLAKQSDLGRKIGRLVENFKKSVALSKLTRGDVQARLDRLEDCWSQFQKNHDVLIFKHKEVIKSSEYLKKDYADLVEEAYLEQRSRLLDMVRQFDGESFSAGTKGQATTKTDNEPRSGSAPLPRMKLPEFSGEYVEWPAFKDLFTSIVGRNSNLSKVDCLHYLKISLKGQAADLIKDLPTINENYDRAWTILREQYENKRILVRSCLEKLASLPRMKESSAQELTSIHQGVISVVNTLEGLGRPIDKTEDWFVFSVVNLFDSTTRNKWEERVTDSSEPPSFTTLKDFMTKRRQQLEASPDDSSSKTFQSRHSDRHKKHEPHSNQGHQSAKNQVKSVRANHAQQTLKPACAKCKGDHFLMQCSEYKALPPADRRGCAERNHLCTNCLGKHQTAACPSTKSCMSCGEKHHSSLHDAFRGGSKQSTIHHTLDCRNQKGKVLLATAIIQVSDSYGRLHQVRALVDQGSEISMLSEGLAQRLQLPRASSNVDIYGVGGQQLTRTRGRVTLTVSSKRAKDTIKVTALVLPKLTDYTHGYMGPRRNWIHLKGLELADPNPSPVQPIEVLLGADVYSAILKPGVRKGAPNEPIGQSTVFGWIVTGLAGTTTTSNHARVHQVTTSDPLSSLVRRFWEQEDIQEARHAITEEEQECENHFLSTHSRTPEGRYLVRLPFRQRGTITPGSRLASLQALKRMETRFRRDEEFKTLYHDFVTEYECLGHMTVAREDINENQAHFLPHHGVLKLSSTTTKLRVVFNGSWAEPSQLSLNDCLHVGPNLLPPLADILLRWRKHKYVVTADVTKMYRQILVHPDDRDHQRILWRNNETQQVSEFRLNTVTYGLSCAPYLAVRTMRQLAADEGSRYPIGAAALKQDAYVDDILTGADSIPELREAATQLYQLCMAGGFPLQKWATNAADSHDVIPQSCQRTPNQLTPEQKAQGDEKTWMDDTHSALGLQWSPSEDTFHFTITKTESQPLTKRGIVSKAAQLFDPLGWLTPVIVRAKITIQSTWLLGLGWDDHLPPALANAWSNYCAELPLLEKVRIPRPLFLSSRKFENEFHGYADASERAYGAVIYVRTRTGKDKWTTTLVTAKSKVAPLKQVSLPRLELCAAHLLARLAQRTITTLDLGDAAIHLWSDSTVALGWIQAHPSRWKTYVANRVADIQRRVPEAQWHHIAGVDNPADCASRGLSPSQLPEWKLWWQGPESLQRNVDFAPAELVDHESLPDNRGPVVAVATRTEGTDDENEVLHRFSSYNRLLRVTAWCRRWLKLRHTPRTSTNTITTNQRRQPLSLTTAEINDAENQWIRKSQQDAYKIELRHISSGQSVQPKSSLAPLAPTLDSNNIIRVGGRLGKASLNPDEAHPIILPPKSWFTHLYVSAAHRSTLHGGVQLTLGTVRQRFWIPKGRSIVKGILNKCVTCLRWRAEPTQQLMGDLPAHRITPARPFLSTGVDYAGPIWVRTTPGRGHRANKGFFAVFICMVTKAVHLEVVSDYTTEAFLAALRRFISRRGICAHLYSDCGTNFQGADRELRRLFSASSLENRSLRDQMANLRIQWHFNPPAAPHFGGLWESAVKSTKHHLRRTIGETRLTFEELTTLLTQIEACLNSRPLAALSDDPDDVTALTPGHFLIGSAINALPEPSLLDEAENRVTRWQMLTKMRDQFWKRWQREYLHGLTMRPRWRRSMENLAVGCLCIIMSDNNPPSHWPLARVTEIHTGTDGKVRVAKLVTATTELLRPVHKLIALPINESDR